MGSPDIHGRVAVVFQTMEQYLSPGEADVLITAFNQRLENLNPWLREVIGTMPTARAEIAMILAQRLIEPQAREDLRETRRNNEGTHLFLVSLVDTATTEAIASIEAYLAKRN